MKINTAIEAKTTRRAPGEMPPCLHGSVSPRSASVQLLQSQSAYLPPEDLLIPGPALSLGLAAEPLLDFMLAPVVWDELMDEWCFMCLWDFACAAIGEPTNAAIAKVPIANLNFVMINKLLCECRE
jgi:hypothetical protein